MAFVVEDGTGLEDATSYTSVEFYRDYHELRGRDTSGETDTEIETRLVLATDYVEKRFGHRWQGVRATDVQALGFPRWYVFIDGVELAEDSVPERLQRAVAEYARRLLKCPEQLWPEPDRKGPVTSTTDTVGPVTNARDYASIAERGTGRLGTGTVPGWAVPIFPAADTLVEPLLRDVRGRTLRA